MELHGRTAVVTGASRGIGRALAVALAKNGCNLLLTAVEADELEEVTLHIAREWGVEVSSRSADLTEERDRRGLVRWILLDSGPADILVNNAGGGRFERFTAMAQHEIKRSILLNIIAPVVLTHELLPTLHRRPEAKIVNISSGISRLPYPGLAIYGAAKGFMSSFSESLACELAGTSVSVLCFHPGFTDTHFMSSAAMDMTKIPKAIIRTPEAVAGRIVKAIKKNRTRAYSDSVTSSSIRLASILPGRIKTRIFSKLFWRLPDV